MKPRIAIYARTSTDRQDKGLESQERALYAYCTTKGMENPTLFVDAGISGAKASRPGLNALMGEVRMGRIDLILVYSFSRFARSTRHLLDSLEEFEKRGVGFISLTENIDTSSAIGKALFTIISAISQLERELISERVKSGLRNAKAKGHRLGRQRSRPSALIRALADQGLPYRKIAELAKCSYGSVANEIELQRSETTTKVVL
jgi:DNA invertase Pin-like site-specific DNA recombinase